MIFFSLALLSAFRDVIYYQFRSSVTVISDEITADLNNCFKLFIKLIFHPHPACKHFLSMEADEKPS